MGSERRSRMRYSTALVHPIRTSLKSLRLAAVIPLCFVTLTSSSPTSAPGMPVGVREISQHVWCSGASCLSTTLNKAEAIDPFFYPLLKYFVIGSLFFRVLLFSPIPQHLFPSHSPISSPQTQQKQLHPGPDHVVQIEKDEKVRGSGAGADHDHGGRGPGAVRRRKIFSHRFRLSIALVLLAAVVWRNIAMSTLGLSLSHQASLDVFFVTVSLATATMIKEGFRPGPLISLVLLPLGLVYFLKGVPIAEATSEKTWDKTAILFGAISSICSLLVKAGLAEEVRDLRDISRAGWEIFSTASLMSVLVMAIHSVQIQLCPGLMTKTSLFYPISSGGGGSAFQPLTFPILLDLTSLVLLLSVSTLSSPYAAGTLLALGSLLVTVSSAILQSRSSLSLSSLFGCGLVVLAVFWSRRVGNGAGIFALPEESRTSFDGGRRWSLRSLLSPTRSPPPSYRSLASERERGGASSTSQSSVSEASSSSQRRLGWSISIIASVFVPCFVTSTFLLVPRPTLISSLSDLDGSHVSVIEGATDLLLATELNGASDRATLGKHMSFPEYLHLHFPLYPASLSSVSSPESDANPAQGPKNNIHNNRTHLWLTISDLEYATILSPHLHLFVDGLNRRSEERGDGRPRVEVVTLCMSVDCVQLCDRMGWYAYGGYMWNKPEILLTYTWPKLKGLIDLLGSGRDAWFVDSDVLFKEDPLSYMEPIETGKYDIQIQDDNIYTGEVNTGFFYMKSKPEVTELWQGVLDMDLKEVSRDQKNFNKIVNSYRGRLPLPGSLTPYLRNEFETEKGLNVFVLPFQRFRPYHFEFGLPPGFKAEPEDAAILHLTCMHGPYQRIYIGCSRGFCQDVNGYYSSPPPVLSTAELSGTTDDLTTILRILLAACHYTGRALVPPMNFTIVGQSEQGAVGEGGSGSFQRKFYELFPNHLLSTKLPEIKILEPNYFTNAGPHLAKRSTPETASDLAREVEIDMRTVWSFPELMERLSDSRRSTSSGPGTSAEHGVVRLVGWNMTSHYKDWELPRKLDKVSTCGAVHVPAVCGEICRWNGEKFSGWMAVSPAGKDDWEDWRGLKMAPRPAGWNGRVQ